MQPSEQWQEGKQGPLSQPSTFAARSDHPAALGNGLGPPFPGDFSPASSSASPQVNYSFPLTAPGYNPVSLTSSDSALLNVLSGPQISPPATETRMNVDVRLRNSNRQAFGMPASHPTYTLPVEPLPPDQTSVSQTITTRPSESSLLDQWPRPWSDSGDNRRWFDELFGGGTNIAPSGYSDMYMAIADRRDFCESFIDSSPLQNSSSYDYSNLGASPRIPDVLKCGIHEPGQVQQKKMVFEPSGVSVYRGANSRGETEGSRRHGR